MQQEQRPQFLQYLRFKPGGIVRFENGVRMNEMVGQAPDNRLVRNRRADRHFPVQLPGIAGDDLRVKMMRNAKAEIRLANRGRAKENNQGGAWCCTQEGEVSDFGRLELN